MSSAAARLASRAPADRAVQPAHVPELVTLHLWRVPRRRVPAALLRMGVDRRIRAEPGVRFAKLLGTGDGATFALRDADPTRWGLLVSWQHRSDADGFDATPTAVAWRRLATSELRIDLRPSASRGRWSGREPFGSPQPRRAPLDGSPVAVLTRATVRPTRTRAFAATVPAVAAALHSSPGLRLALGVGDAPLGLLGTFSVWDSAAAMRTFASRSPAHLDAVHRSRADAWFAEELFAQFAVLAVRGDERVAGPPERGS